MDAKRLMSGLTRIGEVPHGLGYSIWGVARLVEATPPSFDAPGRAVFAVRKDTDVITLARAVTGSRTGSTRILAQRQLRRADGAPLPLGGRALAGERVVLELRGAETVEHPSALPVSVLYEDSFLIGVEKPAGLLVHSDGSEAETLAGRVLAHVRGEGSAAAPQALHRLDMDTTGIVLFSLAAETQPAFDALFLKSQLTKRYFALIQGKLPTPTQGDWLTVEAPVARDRHDARRMRVGGSGKPSVTKVRVIERQGERTLVEAELGTGRRHQIRVHLAHLGCPIVGDELYGGTPDEGGLRLHAHELRFVHPLSGERLVLESSCPW